MALVHHALVQFSNWQVTRLSGCEPSWFKTYLVLGDDVDIAQSALVANAYKANCSALAIIIGLLKSLQSNKNCFEFANRRFSPDGDISPLSLKEELASNSWIARLEYARRILARFGTSYAEPGMAILRKATTVRQWDVLLPELSGNRGDTPYLNAVRFLLESPFSQRELKDLPVGQVLSWLSYLLPKEDKQRISNFMSAPDNMLVFGGVAAFRLIQLLDMEVQKVIDGIPSPNTLGTLCPKDIARQVLCNRADVSGISWATKTVGPRKEERIVFSTMLPRSIAELVSKLEGLNPVREIVYPKGAGTYVSGDGSCSNYDASVSLIYNQYCFAKQNERILDDINLLKRKLVLLKAFLPKLPMFAHEVSAADSYVGTRPDFESSSIFGAVLKVWSDFTALPKVIDPQFEKSINTWLPLSEEGPVPYIEIIHKLPGGMRSVERYLTIVEERTRGPIRALGYALAREFGIITPSLQNMAFEKAPMKGNSWLTLVRQWKRDGTMSRLYSGSALTEIETSEVLLRAIRKARYNWWAMVGVSHAHSGSRNEGNSNVESSEDTWPLTAGTFNPCAI
jgi:hypothetical protein